MTRFASLLLSCSCNLATADRAGSGSPGPEDRAPQADIARSSITRRLCTHLLPQQRVSYVHALPHSKFRCAKFRCAWSRITNTMGMAQLSQQDEDKLRNFCEVLSAALGGTRRSCSFACMFPDEFCSAARLHGRAAGRHARSPNSVIVVILRQACA